MSDFAWWSAAIAGRKPEIIVDQPQCGYFKMRRGRGGAWIPVAIITGRDGDQIALVGAERERRDPLDIWSYCAGNPVPQADAKHAFQNNNEWPGDAPTIGDNAEKAGVGPLELLSDYIGTATAWFKKIGKIEDEKAANQAANYATELLRLKSEADRERDSKVRPHLEAQRQINGEYKPVIEDAEALAKQIKRACDDWLRAEKRRLEEEARKKYEAERKAAEEERQRLEAERAKKMAEDPVAAMTEPEPELPMAPPPPEPVKVQVGGQRGRKMSLRTVTVYEISDYQAALAFAAEHPDVRAAVEKVCRAAAKAGEKVPGLVVKQEERAA